MVGNRKPLDAVGWLLGPDLLSRLRMILRSRRDPRAWMAVFPGFAHDECCSRDGRLIPRGLERASDDDCVIAEVANQDAAARGATAAPAVDPQELWFDHIADIVPRLMHLTAPRGVVTSWQEHTCSEEQMYHSAGKRSVQRGAGLAGAACLTKQSDQLGQGALLGHGLDRCNVGFRQLAELGAYEVGGGVGVAAGGGRLATC